MRTVLLVGASGLVRPSNFRNGSGDALGTLWGRSGDALGRSGTLWGRSGDALGRSGGALGTLWGQKEKKDQEEVAERKEKKLSISI